MGRFAEAAEKWKQAPRIAGHEYWLPNALYDSIDNLEDFTDFLNFFAEGLSKDGFKTDIGYAEDLLWGLASVFQNSVPYELRRTTYVGDDCVVRPRQFKSQYAIVAAMRSARRVHPWVHHFRPSAGPYGWSSRRSKGGPCDYRLFVMSYSKRGWLCRIIIAPRSCDAFTMVHPRVHPTARSAWLLEAKGIKNVS
jgi:hypothetical protein